MGRYIFETQANFSTAKSPMGAFEEKEVENDITKIIKSIGGILIMKKTEWI